MNRYLTNPASGGRSEDGMSPESYLSRLQEEQESTVSDYIDVKLIIPKRLADQCGSFLRLLQDVLTKFAAGKLYLETGDPVEFAEKFREALTIAYTQMPGLMEEIENSARQIIHEESN